jgi:hypothetical protein
VIDHAANRARSLEIAELRRRGLLFKTIGGRLGVSEQLAWLRLGKGCPHFWGDIPLARRARVGPGVPRLASEPPPRPAPSPSPWWRPDPITRALCRAIRAEMRRDSGRVCFRLPEH